MDQTPDFLQADPESFEALKYEVKHLQRALMALICVGAVDEKKAQQAYELTEGLDP